MDQASATLRTTPSIPVTGSGAPGRWGWVVVFGGFTVHFTVMGLQYTFGILFKAILDDKELQEASGNGGSMAASTWAGKKSQKYSV